MTQYPDSRVIEDNLTKAFAETNEEVYKMTSDVRFSGSTCTSIITYGRRVYCANVGDSRTVLIRAAPGSTNGKFHIRSYSFCLTNMLVLLSRMLGKAIKS